MVLVTVLGIFSYLNLGQSEDPPFTFKLMVVQVYWPGATANEMQRLVADRIETTLLESPHIGTVKSFSRPGEVQVFVSALDATPASEIPSVFYQIRKRIGDIQQTLPSGVLGPYFNDEFGVTFGNIFALTGQGYTLAQLRRTADDLRKELLRVKGVAKVDIIGAQDEKIYINLSNEKLATLGFSVKDIAAALQAANILLPSGSFDTREDRIYLRPSGSFQTQSDIANLPIHVGGRTMLLKDVATIRRGYVDPPEPLMRYEGVPAIGIGVSMKSGGDIIQLGHRLDTMIGQFESRLPIGLTMHRVNDQPRAVHHAIGEFVSSVAEALVIVLAVSFISLGLRAGMVVAVTIPLVLAATFMAMSLLGIGLNKVSMGALILSLGLLVDDAIIAIEMMTVKMEEGLDRVAAASFSYTTTAFPMLTGTLITAAGFLPIAMAQSTVGEYTRSLFQVVGISLLLSWLAAVVVVPYLGWKLLPDVRRAPLHRAGWLHTLSARQHQFVEAFYHCFKILVIWCVVHRKLVLVLTVGMFFAAIYSFKYVEQQFFPDATRLELLVDLRLAEGSSLPATERAVFKLEHWLDGHKSGIVNYVSYVGSGSPRFYISLYQQLAASNFAQFVITTRDIPAREQLRNELITLVDGPKFSGLRGRVLRLENGPPVGFPVQFRISGSNFDTLRDIADHMAAVMRVNPNLRNVQTDWDERTKAIFIDMDTSRAAALGVNKEYLARLLQTALQGTTLTTYRERNHLIGIVLRGAKAERNHLALLGSLNIPTALGGSVPLSQLATLRYGMEDGLIWHSNREPTITVRGDIYSKAQAPTVSAQIQPAMDALQARLPLGYRIETGGAVEESVKANDSIYAGIPLFLIVVLTLLMLQLQSFQLVIIVVLTAPLGLIGVAAAQLLFARPFGFVAMLGTIALFGMIMRNSVILIDQIERNIRGGDTHFDAVVEAAVRRFRPIMLTALAAIMAMIPLSHSVFFGLMATAIMGGLAVATVLTLLFLPALYATWFRIKR